MEISQFFQQNIYYLLFAVIALLFFKNRLLSRFHGIQTISLEDSYEIYKRKSGNTVFLDVRTPWELEREPKMKKAKSIPLSELKNRIGELKSKGDDAKQIIIFCRTTSRARNAAIKLKKAGLSDIFVMNGGINGWLRANYPVIRPKVRPTIG